LPASEPGVRARLRGCRALLSELFVSFFIFIFVRHLRDEDEDEKKDEDAE
jgi:hypothetical protein